MSERHFDRRGLLRMGAALSVLGAGGPLAFQLAASAAAAAGSTDYKAIVCLFLYGGNDATNTVLATDDDTWGRYFAARNTGAAPIALMPVGAPRVPVGSTSTITGRKVLSLDMPEAWGGVLRIDPLQAQPVPPGTSATTRSFALHPFLGPLQSLFQRQRLAILANVGTLVTPITKADFAATLASPSGTTTPVPPGLFSHNDQQSVWQSGGAEGDKIGWGGLMADTVVAANGASGVFTAISPAGNAVFLAGHTVRQYIVNPAATPALLIAGTQSRLLFTSSQAPQILSQIVNDTTASTSFANDYSAVVTRSVSAATIINGATSQGAAAMVPNPPLYVNPISGATQVNNLAQQLQTVAKIIAAAPGLGLTRQVFHVGLLGFDTHSLQNVNQPDLLGQLAQALAYFDGVLTNLGGQDISASVTTFTASDFGRGFTVNGDGTDHGWGSHHFIMGGAVRGGVIYGQYPTLGLDSATFTNPDMLGNTLIPTTAVDQYAATLGAWFGVSPANLSAIFPNLGNFSTANLGFV